MLCHVPHGSPNTALLNVSEPALCLQCHSGHHNGASLPIPDRCTNCHGSIHGTDVATPSGGSRFVDKGPYGLPNSPPQPSQPFGRAGMLSSPHASMQAALPAPVASHPATLGLSAAGLGGLSRMTSLGAFPQASSGTAGTPGEFLANSYSAYSITPGSYQFLDLTGFGGRVGEYNSLQQSPGIDASTAYVSIPTKTTLVTRSDVLTGDDYRFAAQLTVSKWFVGGFDLLSLVQQQDHYPFWTPVLSSDFAPPDGSTDLIPSHAEFAVNRRLGNASAGFKVPKIPVHAFVTGDWQARSGLTQGTVLDENAAPAVYDQNGVNTTCGQLCHYTSRYQSVNYTTRNIGVGFDADLGPVRLTYQHKFTNFNDRLIYPIGVYTGPFRPANEGYSIVNPPPAGPAPLDVAAGNYYLDIPSPNQSNSDQVNLVWTASPRLIFNGNVIYSRLTNTYTNNKQNTFGSDETLNWRPINRLLLTADYHQQNLINDFMP